MQPASRFRYFFIIITIIFLIIYMANRFVLNETSYHGAGVIAEIATEVIGRGFKKAFVCSDPDLIKFGVTKKVTDVPDNAGLAYEIYSNIKPNPTIENVQSGVAAFKAAEADYIIAIGGGSSMDTAKGVGIVIANPNFADIKSLEGVAPTKNKSVPIFAVPTTAGIPADLKDIVKPEDIPFLAQSAYDDACRPGNLKETSVEDITKLYESLI